MAFDELKYTQSVWHYQVTNSGFCQEDGIRVQTVHLRRTVARCRKCRSKNVAAYKHRERTIQGLPNGKCPVRFVVPVRKIVCRDCGASTYESVEFAAYRNARITRQLSRAFLRLASKMSMKAIAEEFHVSWRTVRDAIEDGLRKRYARMDYSNVRNIGVDELYVFGSGRPGRRFITVVRCKDDGRVLEVARGKGADALRRFTRKIAPFRRNIRSISMDMANSYTGWARKEFPDAGVVIDPFHVVKTLNDRVQKARRKVAGMVDEATAKRIKGCRSLFVRNREDLTPKQERKFNSIVNLDVCRELSTTHLFKERMRSIYRNATTIHDARVLLDEWIADALVCDVAPIRSAARTFNKHKEGILGHWSHGHASNASTEGFNRKIEGLLMNAYGFHDYKFLRLRIFDLGERHSIKD